jgi:hypothetical protein
MNRITLTAITLTAFAAATTHAAPLKPVPGPGGGPGPRPCLVPPADATPLTETEADHVLGLRQEEKLARDVYLALYERWQHPVFRIHRAEQRHMDAMAVLITRYELDDPVADDTPGVFADPLFAELYAELTEAGSTSLLEALKVGARVEEMDIADLRDALRRDRRVTVGAGTGAGGRRLRHGPRCGHGPRHGLGTRRRHGPRHGLGTRRRHGPRAGPGSRPADSRALTESRADRADRLRLRCAGLVPLDLAAERVNQAHEVAAAEVRARGRPVGGAAVTGGCVAARDADVAD